MGLHCSTVEGRTVWPIGILFLFTRHSELEGFTRSLPRWIHSTEDTSAQWPARAASTRWEAGTWTHSSLPTRTRPSIRPWKAMTRGRTRGGLCTRHFRLLWHNRSWIDHICSQGGLCLRFVSSLPLTHVQVTMSLSHDVPLVSSLGHCLYVLGSIQRTGEKLLLQYNTKQGDTGRRRNR